MSFQDLVKTVSGYAPTLGSALGGPVGSIIGTAISSVFGGSHTDPQDLVKRINEDPEAALKLRTIEFQNAQALSQINAQNYLTEVDDRKDARKNSPQFKDFLRHMAYLITFGFFATLFLLFLPQTNLNPTERQMLSMLVGILVSKWGTIVDFFYGSSHK